MLLSAPAVQLLRAGLPDARLVYLVGPWSAAAACCGPALDEVRTLAFPGFTRHANANLLAPYFTLARSAAELRDEGYDLAVVLRADHWWGALLALWAGIPLRIGASTPETRPLLTHLSPSRPTRPWGEQALDVARVALSAVGAAPVTSDAAQQFTVTDAARAAADTLWRQHGLASQRVVGIHPAAGAPLKSWPLDRWARLADTLLDSGLGVALIGASDDAELLASIGRRMRGRVPTLSGQPLEVSAAIYARCGLLVSVDSGAGHLAAAVGTPTVRLYGPASPTIFGPWPTASGHRALVTDALACAPCGYLDSPPCGARASPACMLALEVEDVLNAVRVELRQG